jgi:predicted GIY-YIG superfamily endonuclease
MSNGPDIHWEGQSGAKYGYWIAPLNAPFKEQPGNYIFAYENRPGYWTPVYIGQTNNLKRRLENHSEDECARRNGATHIHTHISSSNENVRKQEEKDLVRKWSPPCNEHYT